MLKTVFGAADGNRTHVSALGGQCSTTELQPQILLAWGANPLPLSHARSIPANLDYGVAN